jgi:branched-chain amino acid aminotransferase
MPALAKAGANYMNSQLIRMEAEINGYQEGIALDVNGLVSEGSGENIFVVRNGVIYTPPLATPPSLASRATACSPWRGTWDSPWSNRPSRARCFTSPTKSSSPARRPKSQPIRTIDRIVVGDGKVGEITKKIADEFFGIANGLKPDRFGWLTPVNVNAAETVPA